MNIVVQTLLPYVLIYKYLAIFIITYLGAILLPLPSGTILMAAAAFSTQGYFNWFIIWLIGWIGNVAGDNSGYWIARHYGQKVLRKIGFRRMLDSKNFDTTAAQIHDHPVLTIVSSRFMTAVAPSVNVICGLSKMDYLRYLTYEALGELTEVTIFCGLGYFFGSNWQYVDQLFGKAWIILGAGIPFSWVFWKYIIGRKSSK